MKFFYKISIVLLLTTFSIAAIADGDKTKSAPAEQQKAMLDWEKLAAPSASHQLLAQLAGKWEYTLKWWTSADSNPEQSQGTNENSWIMDGRFLTQKVSGIMLGQPFEGLGITGYDNIRGEYSSVWIDNMNTGMMQTRGAYNSKTKTITEVGTMSCPMTGETARPFRAEWELTGKNRYAYRMYTTGPDDKIFKSLDIQYRRVG